MTMRLYNTLTRTEETFAPSVDNTVRMYTCGLTVYARGHIGNFRTFICLDVLRRTLKYLEGHQMRQVMNFTDVDDRTILGAQKAGMDLRAYTDQYIAAFREDAAALGLEAVEAMPRATDPANLQAMADLIHALEKNGHTYVSDGSIYFKISTMPDYGQLAHLDHEGMKPGARVDSDTYAKDDARDFVLWKATKPDEPTWNLVDPPGRPGWHLECSAMALRLLGESPIDIHAGGIDLIFPHHENEIAQSECVHLGKPFAQIWMHNGFVTVDGAKMAKSEGNFRTIREVLDEAPGEAARLAMLMGHYRDPLDWTSDRLQQAKQGLDRFYLALRSAGEVAPGTIAPRVAAALEDDLNTPLAIAVLHELLAELNKATSAEEKQRLKAELLASGAVMGLLQQDPEAWLKGGQDDAASIEAAIVARNAARKAKNFAEADRIRTELALKGILLEDGPAGTTWRRAG